MSNLYNERKQQQRDDAERAAAESPTAFVARDKHGNELGIYDYGPEAGVGSADLPEREGIEAGVKSGQLAAFDAFLRAQTDPISQWLRTFDPLGNPRAFNDALAHWVRKWDAAGLTLPECVDWQRKP
ncbi:MAG: hypothetical protein IT438_14895 [Phycisphaerales bacterium]|nr:hypothetical protein [Phycisphaerales bacterium]